ncbi:hypothetical protein C8Q76DRAFT_799184 [Earliella scabrosa]|nr:hypothetical protein C8Q76DRAFT_799184 [Earliella scabrosa]
MVKNRLIIPTCIPVNFMVKYKSIWTQVCLIAWLKIISILRTVTLQMNTAYDARLGTRHHTPNSPGPLRHFAIPAADEDHDGAPGSAAQCPIAHHRLSEGVLSEP